MGFGFPATIPFRALPLYRGYTSHGVPDSRESRQTVQSNFGSGFTRDNLFFGNAEIFWYISGVVIAASMRDPKCLS